MHGFCHFFWYNYLIDYRIQRKRKMQLFSEYLRDLIKTKQMSVSLLARLTGVERTLLSKTLTGQRVLPYHALDDLIYHLKLSPEEEKRIRLYYDAQFEKEGIRRSRELIGKMFSDLSCLDLSARAFEETRLLMNIGQYAGERMVFVGETNVQFLQRMVLSEEMSRPDSRVELTVPISDTFLNGELLHRYLDDKTSMEISQIICFDASSTGADINLDNLGRFCRILPVCLLSKQHYHPYYYYDNPTSTRYTDPFPYFLVSHSCVVCLSKDGTCALLLRSPDAVSYYHRYFQTLTEECYSLIQYTSNPLEILNSYQKCTEPDGFYMAMDQPCFGRFYTDDFILSHIRKELPGYEQILGAAMERFSLLRMVTHFYTFFSEAGVKRFLKEGTLDDFPVEIVTTFSREEREGLMRSLASAIRSGNVTGSILREGVFPDYLAVCTSQEHGVGFFTTRQFPLSDALCSVWMKEPNLCRAFHGWMKHLPDSSLTLTAGETADILEKLVNEKEKTNRL